MFGETGLFSGGFRRPKSKKGEARKPAGDDAARAGDKLASWKEEREKADFRETKNK